jgi:hypothetical protein
MTPACKTVFFSTQALATSTCPKSSAGITSAQKTFDPTGALNSA